MDVKEIYEARERLRGHIKETPVVYAANLGEMGRATSRAHAHVIWSRDLDDYRKPKNSRDHVACRSTGHRAVHRRTAAHFHIRGRVVASSNKRWHALHC